MMTLERYPNFESLPVDHSGPKGNAWGLWGKSDQLGTLNHLADDVVAKAAKEALITGQRVSLKWVQAVRSDRID